MFQNGDLVLHKDFGWLGIVIDVWERPGRSARVYWSVGGYNSVCLLQNLIPYSPPS
jgi:hypothetical protein